jgi:hypothetical protein
MQVDDKKELEAIWGEFRRREAKGSREGSRVRRDRNEVAFVVEVVAEVVVMVGCESLTQRGGKSSLYRDLTLFHLPFSTTCQPTSPS